MTERERVADALSAHRAFEPADDGFAATTTAASARVAVVEMEEGVAIELTIRVPTIDAVVAGETVAEVVREGWLETFERRLEDLGGVARGEVGAPTVSADSRDEEVVVETTVRPETPRAAAEDAKAVVDSVEGTWIQGLIPGYDYRAPASELLERARSAGERHESS